MKRIFYNGKIVTMEEGAEGLLEAEAMLIEDGRYVRIGSNEEVSALAEETTEWVDLERKLVLPAFTETHMHVLSLGRFLKDVKLQDAGSISEVIERTKKYKEEKKIPKGTWITGRGWNQEHFTDEVRFLNRYDLDQISTENPMAFTRTCGHMIVVNSKALELMGMSEEAPVVEGGQVDLDERGKPLGIFREKARKLVLDAIPEQTVEELKELICLAADNAVASGITEIHTDDFKDVPNNFQKVIDAYEELKKEGKMKVRIYEQCNLPSVAKIEEFIGKGYYTGWGDATFKLGPLKLLEDGSLGSRTAYLREPYSDEPSAIGIHLFEQEELDAMILTAHKNGMQVAIHAIGDRACDMVLDSIEKAKKAYPREDCRHGIIHCQITDHEQIDRFKELGLIAYIQPIFLNNDIKIVESRIGKERASTAYNWKEFVEKGVTIAGGSDCPVESLDVLENIYTATLRKDLRGWPQGGWRPEQNLTLLESLKSFTVNAAYASFSEREKGSIREGKLADFVVLSENIWEVPTEQIKNIKVEQTYHDGNLVFDRAME